MKTKGCKPKFAASVLCASGSARFKSLCKLLNPLSLAEKAAAVIPQPDWIYRLFYELWANLQAKDQWRNLFLHFSKMLIFSNTNGAVSMIEALESVVLI